MKVGEKHIEGRISDSEAALHEGRIVLRDLNGDNGLDAIEFDSAENATAFQQETGAMAGDLFLKHVTGIQLNDFANTPMAGTPLAVKFWRGSATEVRNLDGSNHLVASSNSNSMQPEVMRSASLQGVSDAGFNGIVDDDGQISVVVSGEWSEEAAEISAATAVFADGGVANVKIGMACLFEVHRGDSAGELQYVGEIKSIVIRDGKIVLGFLQPGSEEVQYFQADMLTNFAPIPSLRGSDVFK